MCGDVLAALQRTIGQKPFVSFDQPGGNKRGLKAHAAGPIRGPNCLQGGTEWQIQRQPCL